MPRDISAVELPDMDLEKTCAATRNSMALNSFWNLVGQATPLLLAISAVPILVRRLGIDRFGVLTLAWVLVGYLSLLDLGIGRATTKLLAEKIALNDSEGAANLIWTSVFSMLIVGVCFAALLVGLSPWLTHSVLKISAELHREALHSLYWMALAIPFVTLASGLRGMLEAQQQFGAVNILRVALGAITYLGPVIVVKFSRNLVPVVATLVLARIVSCLLHFWLCSHFIANFFTRVGWHRSSLLELLSFGTWITVSNIISPIMVYLDRFLIGSVISMSAVAYYTTPSELVTKLWIIPASIAAALFPAFSQTNALNNQERTNWLYDSGLGGILALVFPLTLALAFFAPEVLRLWLGVEFARHSAAVLKILVAGVFINSLANVPYAYLQASGRPDWTAKLHVAELPCYAGLLYWATTKHGIEGAAAAWSFRVTVEAIVLFLLTRSLVKNALALRVLVTIIYASAILLLSFILNGLMTKAAVFALSLSAFLWVTWSWTFTSSQRLRVRSWLKHAPALAYLR